MNIRFSIKNKGFSLVEVLVALGIFSIGILGAIGIFPLLFKSINNSWNNSKVVFISQKSLDDLITKKTFVPLQPQTISPSPPQIPKGSDGKPLGTVEYWGDPPQPTGNPRIQVVYVKVKWTESNRLKEYTITGAIMP